MSNHFKQFKKMAVAKWAGRSVLIRPELQAGARVRVELPGVWTALSTVTARDGERLYLEDGGVEPSLYVRADGVFQKSSGRLVNIEVVQAPAGAPEHVSQHSLTVFGPRARSCAELCGKRNAEPHLHRHDCPVAPVPGLHGGMREHPVLAGKVVEWRPGGSTYSGYDASGTLLACTLPSLRHVSEVRDVVLAAFYLPPVQPKDKPERLPVDGDPELECVAARATHEPERWKSVTR